MVAGSFRMHHKKKLIQRAPIHWFFVEKTVLRIFHTFKLPPQRPDEVDGLQSIYPAFLEFALKVQPLLSRYPASKFWVLYVPIRNTTLAMLPSICFQPFKLVILSGFPIYRLLHGRGLVGLGRPNKAKRLHSLFLSFIEPAPKIRPFLSRYPLIKLWILFVLNTTMAMLLLVGLQSFKLVVPSGFPIHWLLHGRGGPSKAKRLHSLFPAFIEPALKIQPFLSRYPLIKL